MRSVIQYRGEKESESEKDGDRNHGPTGVALQWQGLMHRKFSKEEKKKKKQQQEESGFIGYRTKVNRLLFFS